jgi:hypothetical protein
MSWTAVKAYCESIGGHLATITSAAEQAAVYELVKKGDKNMYWIGGYRYDDELLWVTGEPWRYSNWDTGEPNNAGGVENYVQMYRESGKWNDGENRGDPLFSYWSLENTGFICEWDD